ncbi:hypothetical protein [Helcococcus massiliensis]|uniref:hypothetical protein n=1 Tax=Helcococcus massiliensis TaxID=2040290 RepID=UPI000CDE9252|nr:hypothetical protein [Helcococcus massiliensis]
MLEDFINVNKRAFNKTLENIKFVPILALVLFLSNIAMTFIMSLLSSTNQASDFILGFIRYIVSVAFASLMVTILEDIVFYNRFSTDNLKEGFSKYLSPLMNTYFYLAIANIIVSNLAFTLKMPIIIVIFAYANLVIQSTIYEQTYIARQSGINAIVDSLKFIINNILYWILPMLVFVLINRTFEVFSILSLSSIDIVIRALVQGLMLAFIYLYKGHLFNILYSSSRRKREFEGMFD